MIETFKLDSDERGWLLELGGDFVREVTSYLNDETSDTLTLRLGDDAGLLAAATILNDWLEEGRRMAAQYADEMSLPEADEAYARDDPKHGEYHSVHADIYDQREGK